jgi:transposase
MQYIAFDSHKRYTQASVISTTGAIQRETRIAHESGAVAAFLAECEPGSPVALESIGNWYWIVDEIEKAGMVPRLVHPRKAKMMMGMINKTDKLDARGLNRLQQSGTLPAVWIPPGDLRDKRDLPRTRMVLTQQRTRLKNRIHATLAKYALGSIGFSDAFGKKGREILRERIQQLPPETQFATERLMEEVTSLDDQIGALESRTRDVLGDTSEIKLLMSLPGVGFILATVIALEIGDVTRFPEASRLASYAGTTPRVHSSGGKTRFGTLRSDVNLYLKWAFTEASNSICINARHWPDRHVVRLYRRIRDRKGYPKAIGAVSRHLAEASFWMLKKGVPYAEPASHAVSSTEGLARASS